MESAWIGLEDKKKMPRDKKQKQKVIATFISQFKIFSRNSEKKK